MSFIFFLRVFTLRLNANRQETEKIDKKFGYLFCDFDQNTAYSQTFHFVFFIRRMIIAILIFIPLASELRLILSSLLSLSVIII